MKLNLMIWRYTVSVSARKGLFRENVYLVRCLTHAATVTFSPLSKRISRTWYSLKWKTLKVVINCPLGRPTKSKPES